MNKILKTLTAILLTMAVAFTPSLASAHAGETDEIDGHYYESDGVSLYSLQEGKYHYHPKIVMFDYDWNFMADDPVFRPFMVTDGVSQLATYVMLESFDIHNNESGFYTETRFREDGTVEKWISRFDDETQVSFPNKHTMLVERGETVTTVALDGIYTVQTVNYHYFVPLDVILPEFNAGVMPMISPGTRTTVYGLY